MATSASTAAGQATQRSWATRLRARLGLGTPASPRQVARRPTGLNPFVGELGLFAGSFEPQGWAFCDGRALSVNDYGDLYAVLGTTYGGNGRPYFNLPDLRSRVPVHVGTRPGGSPYALGQTGGAERVGLSLAQLPAHTHALPASAAPGTTASPLGAVPADSGAGSAHYTPDAGPGPTTQPTQPLGPAGNNEAHDNVQPVLAVNFIIALYGSRP